MYPLVLTPCPFLSLTTLQLMLPFIPLNLCVFPIFLSAFSLLPLFPFLCALIDKYISFSGPPFFRSFFF